MGARTVGRKAVGQGQAMEAFLAGTAAEVTAVREIGPHRFTPGRITETLMQAYDHLVLQSPEEVARIVG